MPFTVSHVVAVIPLYKYLGKFGALSALVIGSMIPDFAYMTPYLVHQRMYSHSLVGIYLYGIPMGLTIYFLYHFLMAPVIVSLLPKKLSQYLHADLFLGRIPNIPSYILVLSLVLGAITHVVWDFFTHFDGIPQYINWFHIPLVAIDGYDILPYRVLQHFSSIFGLSLLMFLIWIWMAKRRSQKTEITQSLASSDWHASKRLKGFSTLVLLVIPTLIGASYSALNAPLLGDALFGLHRAQVFLRYGIVSAAAAFIICCVLLGIIYQFQIQRHNKNAGS